MVDDATPVLAVYPRAAAGPSTQSFAPTFRPGPQLSGFHCSILDEKMSSTDAMLSHESPGATLQYLQHVPAAQVVEVGIGPVEMADAVIEETGGGGMQSSSPACKPFPHLLGFHCSICDTDMPLLVAILMQVSPVATL